MTKRLTVLLVALAFATMGVASVVSADKDDGKEHKDGLEEKFIYLNAGVIGENLIGCFGTQPEITVPDEIGVTITDPSNEGSTVTSTSTPVPVIGGETLVDETVLHVCIGGALSFDDGSTIPQPDPADPNDRAWWEVWVHDYIWNGCARTRIDTEFLMGTCDGLPEGLGEGLDGLTGIELKTAAFARIQTEYDYTIVDKDHPDATQICTLDLLTSGDPQSVDVCIRTPSGTVSAFRNTHNFGLCGQGAVEIDSTVMDPAGGPGTPFPGTVVHQKQVFLDGPVRYLLDCADAGSEEIRDAWTFAAQTVNSFVCPDPVLGSSLVCVFEELPAAGSDCFAEKSDIETNNAVLGLVGEIGWHHPTEEPVCVEEFEPTGNAFHDNWGSVGPGAFSIVFKFGPEPLSCVAQNAPLRGACQMPNGQTVPCEFDQAGTDDVVTCTIPDGCDGKVVNAVADLTEGTAVQTELRCDGTVIASTLDNTADGIPTNDEGVKPATGDYVCEITFVDKATGVGTCFDP